MVGPTTPVVVEYAVPRLLVYFTESAKYASSAVIRLRRSDFIEARYAFSFVFANFGIAIAAKMPMITTTIRSSISVKPLRFIWTNLPCKVLHRHDNFRPVDKHKSCLRSSRCAQAKLHQQVNRSEVCFSSPQKGGRTPAFCNAPRQTQEALSHWRNWRYHHCSPANRRLAESAIAAASVRWPRANSSRDSARNVMRSPARDRLPRSTRGTAAAVSPIPIKKIAFAPFR